MKNELNFKSNINNYLKLYFFIVFLIILFNFIFVKELKQFSFEYYFLMMIPMWIGCLSINNYETEKLKEFVRKYSAENHPEKLKEFEDKPINLLDSDTEDILDLLKDEKLLEDKNIAILKNEAKKITLFMYSVFISMPLVLLFVVFVILRW